ncbi:unnamed protein product [Leuciscus chuanchicus]
MQSGFLSELHHICLSAEWRASLLRNCPVLDVDASDLSRFRRICVSQTTLVSGRSGQFYVKNVDVQNYASSLQGESENALGSVSKLSHVECSVCHLVELSISVFIIPNNTRYPPQFSPLAPISPADSLDPTEKEHTLLRNGKGWRSPENCMARCHLRNWKVMLLVFVCFLGLVDGHFLHKETEEPRPSKPRTSSNRPERPGLQKDLNERQSRAPWAGLHDTSLTEEGEGHRVRWQSSSTNSSSSRKSPKNRKERRNRARGRSNPDCRLEKKEMKVRDLGLGYDSDEIVMFKYCVGTCMSARKNYDLALKVLTDNGSVSGRKVSTHPCCRPTRFETVSFMDAQTSWQTIKWLSAANCSCVG